jgi:hypothetical protein
MAEATAGAGISTITPPAGTPNIGSGSGSSHTDAGAGSSHESGQSHESGHGSGEGSGQAAKPSKFSFDLGDGSGPTEISFEDEGSESGASGAGDTAFKFADLDAIKDSNPDLYKSLKSELSKASRFGKFGLKSPEEYRAVSERINRLSNGKGLDGIEQTMQRMASELQGFRSGDVQNWAKESPEEFALAASKMVDQWGQVDAKGYVGHVAKAAMYALLQKDNYGQSAIDAFNAAYAATTDANTKKLLDRVAHTLDAINQNSQYVPDQTAVRQRQLDQQEARVFSGKVDNATDPLVNQAVNRALTEGAKQLGLELDQDDIPGFREAMRKEWYEAAKKNGKFMADLAKARDTKNIDEIASLVRANRQAFAAEALKAIYRTRLSKVKQSLKREAASKQEAGSAGAAQNQGQVTPYSGKMDPRTGAPDVDFDFSRMRDADYDMAASRHFYVKGKKDKFSY